MSRLDPSTKSSDSKHESLVRSADPAAAVAALRAVGRKADR